METVETKDLAVRIESEGGALTLTPMGLLQHFLPGATPLPNNPRVFEGRTPGQPDRKCYVQAEALAGMLMEAREKHINPISGFYLIPSNHPDKPASHKIKYDVGVQRARRIPGFLGMNMGLLVKRGQQIVETSGEMSLDGDQIMGAWAEVYIAGLPRPLRKEVSRKEFWGVSKIWNEKGGFMLIKVAVDHLLRLNFPTLYDDSGAGDAKQEEEVTLEAAPVAETNGNAGTQQHDFVFEPGTLYVGELTALNPREGKKAGSVAIETEHGSLLCFFWSRPEILKEHESWGDFIGQPAGLVFTEKEDKAGRKWRYVETLDIASQSAEEQLAQPEEEGD